MAAEITELRECKAELLAAHRDHARQMESLSAKLAADVPPGHCDYIGKKRAAEWLLALVGEARAAIARAEAGRG
jgi:hypothetical protein